MSVIRRNNFLGQQRVDVVDMRSIDSGIAHDIDVLAGKIMAGQRPLVIRGLTIDTTASYGNPATSLLLTTAGSLVMHYGATEAGTLLEIPDTQAADQLFSGNSRVVGSFASSATNYVGIDYLRTADATTADQTKFLSANTGQETTQSVPKGIVLDYRIIISTSPFTLATNVCPVAIIITDSGGNVASVTDARSRMTRLASGGDVPDPDAGFEWPDASRRENPNTYSPSSSANPFSGGDKEINSIKELFDAMMTVLWEAKSGEAWYSPTSRDNIKIGFSPNLLGNGTNFDWDSGTSTFEWSGIRVLFENSSGTYYNSVANDDAIVADGQCLYVDIDRKTSPAATLVAQVGTLQSLPSPVIPGSRLIIAWRLGADMYVRDYPFEVGRILNPVATTTTDGVVRLNITPGDAVHPKVLAVGVNGAASNAATAGNTPGFAGIGFGTGDGVTGNGGDSDGAGVFGEGGLPDGDGVIGFGTGAGSGVYAQGGATDGFGVIGLGVGAGIGVSGTGGATAGIGVKGVGVGAGTGVFGEGGVTNGVGVQGNGTGANAKGVVGQGTGTAAGVTGSGGATGAGVIGTGGSTSGTGVAGTGIAGNASGVTGQGVGTGNGVTGSGGGSGGEGVRGNGGNSDGWGVFGVGGSPDGGGVFGLATGQGVGVFGQTALTGNSIGVQGYGYSSNSIGVEGVASHALSVGISAYNDDGIALEARGEYSAPARASLHIAPQDTTPNANPTGPNVIGDIYVTTAGVLKICTVAGSPGTWVSVGSQV